MFYKSRYLKAPTELPHDHSGYWSESDWVILFNASVQDRGTLVYANNPTTLPFLARRVMVIHGVPAGEIRGKHGHIELQELLICVQGSCDILLDDCRGRREIITISNPSVGILVDRLVWTEQFNHSSDCILTVMASAEHNPKDVYSDYDAFKTIVKNLT